MSLINPVNLIISLENKILRKKKKKRKKICYSNPQQQPSPLYQYSAILKITQVCPIGVPADEWRAKYNILSTHEKCESYLPFSKTVDRSY
jgi:hypothetical protein